MIRVTKKVFERRVLDAFISAVPALAGKSVVTSENPDFLLGTGSDVLGIEITGIFEEAISETESAWWDVMERCVSECQNRHLPYVHVHVFFHPRRFAQKAERTGIARHIVDCVQEHMPSEEQMTTVRSGTSRDNSYHFPPCVRSVLIGRYGVLTRHFFAPSEFGFAKTLDADMLQSRIMSKNKRVSSYYTQCTHCWLVIAYDVSGFASFYTAVPSLCDSEYDILFDRVILFNGTIGTVTELKAKPGAPQG